MRSSSSISAKGSLGIEDLENWRSAWGAVRILDEAEVLESGLDLFSGRRERSALVRNSSSSPLALRPLLPPLSKVEDSPCSATSSKTSACSSPLPSSSWETAELAARLEERALKRARRERREGCSRLSFRSATAEGVLESEAGASRGRERRVREGEEGWNERWRRRSEEEEVTDPMGEVKRPNPGRRWLVLNRHEELRCPRTRYVEAMGPQPKQEHVNRGEYNEAEGSLLQTQRRKPPDERQPSIVELSLHRASP